MDEDQQERTGPEVLLEAWLKAATDFWGSAIKMWSTSTEPSGETSESQGTFRSRPQEMWESSQKLWQAMVSSLSEPGTMDAFSRGINALPDIASRMAQIGWDGYFHLYQQWLKKAGSIGEQSEAYRFDNLDRNVFKAWLETYETDFRQFLNLPQLGLTRVYQERLNRTVDKFNIYQVAAAEFLSLLYLPVEKSLRVVGEQLQETSETDELPDNFKEYYNMWIKTLEGHYMTLFKSPDYTRTFNKALNAMEDFMLAEQEVLADVLKTLPVPTNQDMDELYKEIYLLKKKLRELEKKVGKP
jgi:class III poly(R)-hydroxyalkanoic acid synthase PhaE subunit